MKIFFPDLPEKLRAGTARLLAALDIASSPLGIHVEVRQAAAIKVCMKDGCALIEYSRRHEFFRALCLFAENAPHGDFCISEKMQFETTGVMLDCSRGGVISLNAAFRYIDYMALMGLNMLMLYTEDTYEVPGRPYFGYMRGRYTYDEIKAIDDYAFDYGIELIPCIQTYSHMEQYLRWGESDDVRDTKRTLLADEEATYSFIDAMISAASAPCRSKKIHIGMDESQEMFRGQYLDKHGFPNDPCAVFMKHLNRVLAIAQEHGLQPMMWSDMLFRMASQNGDTYYDKDVHLPENLHIPQNTTQVYWNYDGDAKTDEFMLDKHFSITENVAFAGRIHTTGPVPNNKYALKTITDSLGTAKKKGVKTAFVTFWGNDGCETDYFLSLLGICAWAENSYSAHSVSTQTLKKRFEFITGADYDVFMRISDFHNKFDDDRPLDSYIDYTQGKRVLYSDVLMGLLDSYVAAYPLSEHYKSASLYMHGIEKTGRWAQFYEFFEVLFDIMELKAEIAEKLKKAYDNDERDFMQRCAKELLPLLKKKADRFYLLYKMQWYASKKPQGFEFLEMRLVHLAARAQTASERLGAYLQGELSELPELMEDRLPFSKFAYNHYDISTVYIP